MIQSIALVCTLLAAFFSLLAGFMAQPLIPNYQFRIRTLRRSVHNSDKSLQELTGYLIEQLEKSTLSDMPERAIFHAKLKNLEDSLNASLNTLQDDDEFNIFEEAKSKARIRLYYMLSFVFIVTSMILQAILIYQNS